MLNVSKRPLFNPLTMSFERKKLPQNFEFVQQSAMRNCDCDEEPTEPEQTPTVE